MGPWVGVLSKSEQGGCGLSGTKKPVSEYTKLDLIKYTNRFVLKLQEKFSMMKTANETELLAKVLKLETGCRESHLYNQFPLDKHACITP